MIHIKNIPKFVIVLLCFVTSCFTLLEGENCVMEGATGGAGICLTLDKCETAKHLLKTKRIYPELCGFVGQTPIVCCPVSYNRSRTRVFRSDKKCEEYHNIRNFPPGVAFGVEAKSGEFPHMAALGYGRKNSVLWLCGGSLISEQFVLTAAHCTKTINHGDPTWVRLGDLTLNDTTDDADAVDVSVHTVFVHSDYKPPSIYNDIALLKLKKTVSFNWLIKPACIHGRKELPDAQMQITGWGQTDFLGDRSNRLLKASLNIIGHKDCAKRYTSAISRKIDRGIDEQMQICAGDQIGRDTCPGDSGGPLQFVKSGTSEVLDHYVIVGITSFGQGCGAENSAGVYTRVSLYRAWIESIVWPISRFSN